MEKLLPRVSHRAETPMAFVRALLHGYEKYGRSPQHALRQAGIGLQQLQRAEARIDVQQMETLSATAMRELDDEALGWFSRRLPWGTYGMLCRASLTAPSLRVALQRWCRHHALLTDDIALSFEASGELARVVIQEHRPLGAVREFCLLTSLRYLHGYACWWVDSQLPLSEVTFPFSPPPHAGAYAFLFPSPVRFSRTQASLAFDARYLGLPPRRDEAALQRMLQHALPLTVRQYRRDRLLVERVRSYLNAPGPRPATAAAVSAALHVSVRSLHRHLASEGASLQHLKEQARSQHATDLLLRTGLPIKQVARRVGFRSEKSFARAFHTWTGASPTHYRGTHREEESG